MKNYELCVPVTDQEIEGLRIGDTVYLTGTIFTSRDMAHLEISKLLDAGKELPVDFRGGVIFHAGPVLKKNGDAWEMVVVGPTTSIRMEPYADMVGKLGVKIIVGKGGMKDDTIAACKKHKQVYLQAPPGCAVKLAAAVRKVEGGYWLEKGMPEALWKLEVERFGPLVVTMDSYGGSIYNDIKMRAREIMQTFS